MYFKFKHQNQRSNDEIILNNVDNKNVERNFLLSENIQATDCNEISKKMQLTLTLIPSSSNVYQHPHPLTFLPSSITAHTYPHSYYSHTSSFDILVF
jgi:hypothetical protein